jgi:hypothetical protein
MTSAESRANGQSVLEHAVQAAGSKEQLAAKLQLSLDELAQYLAGSLPLPTDIFLRALDVIAQA